MRQKKSGRQYNRELAELFHRMAACYRYRGPKDRFRAIAYEAASKNIQGMKDDIGSYATDVKTLDKLAGIGESIAEKIIEYVSTGKVHSYEKLVKEIPVGLLELMDVTGCGPSTVKILHRKLGITNKEELARAIGEGRLKGLRGFGERKIENLLRGLKLYKEGQQRMLLPDALLMGNLAIDAIRKVKGVARAELAGSLRRWKETIGDIDIVVCAKRKDWKQIMDEILEWEMVGRVLARGETRISFLLQRNHVQVDVRLVHEDEFGAALLYFTGSKEHNLKLRAWAKSKGWKLNEYGVFDVATGRKLAGSTEEEIYELFGLQYIPPELREQRGEIEAARRHELPTLIEPGDMRGDLQMHSKWSDGVEDIESIAAHVMKNFPGYEYIVLTDHSPSQRIAGGLKPEEFRRQFEEIDRVNKKLGRPFVKKGVEVDILANGELDLPSELLKEFEWVTAAIHSGFTKDNTDRLMKACEHPSVNCIAHPSGRLIGKREGYPVDWRRLFGKLKSTGTAIEINAQPDRLDLRDQLVNEAINHGVAICISTDAHSLGHFSYMELGVAVARRGWCTAGNVLNTRSWKRLQDFRRK